MADDPNGRANIPVKIETRDEMQKRKIAAEHKAGRPITWDDYLLEETKK